MAEDREISIRISAKNLGAAEFQKARDQIFNIERATNDASRAGDGFAGSFKGALGVLGGFVAAGAVFGGLKAGLSAVVGGAFEMNSTLEKSTLQFGTLMGDSAKAEAHVRSLFEFAKKTPFETGPIIQASRMMQTFGGNALNTEANLTLLGDAAAATGAPIEDLGFWVGRMYANLKAGQPFGEAAARLQELAVLSPQARAEMEALQKSGKSGDEVFSAFQKRMGDFSGAMVAQAGTWEGLKSSISDAVNIMMADALRPLFDLVKTGAAMTLEVLGSKGMSAAFDSAKASIGAAFGGGADGGQGIVKAFASAIITAADLALAGAGLMVRGFDGLRVVFLGTASVVSSLGLAFVTLVETAATIAAKVPGVGDAFKGLSLNLTATREQFAGIQQSFKDQTAEAWEGVKGNSALAQSLEAGRGVLQAMKGEIAAVTLATTAGTAATRASLPPKAEAHALTKAEAAALKEAEKAQAKFNDETRKFGQEYKNLTEQLKAGMLGAWTDTLTDSVNLTARSNAETGKLRGELEAWARTNGATLAPSIKQVTAALVEATTTSGGFRDALAKSFQGLPDVMLKAIQGGGDVGKAAGASIGGSLGEWAGKAAGPALGKMFGSTVGGGLASMFGPLGTMVGGFLGEKIGAVASATFGKVFKTEGKKVNDLRDDFTAAAGGIGELDAKAHAAGLTLDRFLKAKTVKDYQAAIEELNGAFGKQEADLGLAREAMEEWGISAKDAGQKFAQADMDKTAGAMLAKLKAATAAGVDLTAIVNSAGDDFGKMVHQAIRSGTTISNEFRPVLAAMIESGTLIDENGDKFTDLSQIPFADDIGGGLREVAASLKELSEFFLSGVSGAFTKAGDTGVNFADRVRAATGQIPREIDINVNGRYTPPDIDGANTPGYDIGTKGVHGSYFVDHGREKTVRVHNVEAILTPDQAPGFVGEWLRHNAPSALAQAPAPVNVWTVVELAADGRVTGQRAISEAEYLRRRINQMARDGQIQMPARAVGVAV